MYQDSFIVFTSFYFFLRTINKLLNCFFFNDMQGLFNLKAIVFLNLSAMENKRMQETGRETHTHTHFDTCSVY